MAKDGIGFDVIFNELKQKKYRKLYFLQGKEPFFIDKIAEYIEAKVLNEADKAFNQTIFYGKDTDIATVVAAAKRFPMMCDRQVVIVKEAQDIKDIEKYVKIKVDGKDIEVNLLDTYVQNPLDTTILVFCYKYKELDGRKTLAKNLQASGCLFTFGTLYDSELPKLIETEAENLGMDIDQMAVKLMIENIGNNLTRIHNELEKISVNLPLGSKITQEHVVKYVGISKEYNVFELQSALSRRDIYKCTKIAKYLGTHAKENPIQVVISQLFTYFTKLILLKSKGVQNESDVQKELGINPFFAKEYLFAIQNYNSHKLIDIFGYLRTADMQSKGFETGEINEDAILSELIFKILH